MSIPLNTCDFRVGLELKHEGGHYLKVKFDWIDVRPQSAATADGDAPKIDYV